MNTIMKWIALAAMIMALGYAGGYLAVKKHAVMADMPVVVLDVQQFVEQAITGPNGELNADGVDQGILKAQEAARKFADAGYLVLERRSLMAAPPQYLVSSSQTEKTVAN